MVFTPAAPTAPIGQLSSLHVAIKRAYWLTKHFIPSTKIYLLLQRKIQTW
jgi:hypothetical protein